MLPASRSDPPVRPTASDAKAIFATATVGLTWPEDEIPAWKAAA